MLTDNICVDMIKVEIDELWSFVKIKKKQKWLWYAINHDTGEILAYIFGKEKILYFKVKKHRKKSFD